MHWKHWNLHARHRGVVAGGVKYWTLAGGPGAEKAFSSTGVTSRIIAKFIHNDSGRIQMKLMFASTVIVLGLTISASANAQVPAGATGECKDGTYTTAESKSGACSGHGGVKNWTGDKVSAKSASTTVAPAAATATAPPQAPAAPPAPASSAKATRAPLSAAPAAGGGPGKVWVNTNSKVYHCPGDQYYGKTKAGEYMTESAAKAAGNHADHGKACS
jgi:hypothetical protein